MEPTSQQRTFLEDANVAILATTGPGNRAHAMPVWYVYEGGQIIMGAGANSQKRRNIDRNGQATLVIDRREPPYHALMVHGRAEVGPAAAQDMRLKIASRYLGEQRAREYVEETAGGDSITIRLTPQRFIEYGSPSAGG